MVQLLIFKDKLILFQLLKNSMGYFNSLFLIYIELCDAWVTIFFLKSICLPNFSQAFRPERVPVSQEVSKFYQPIKSG